MILNNQSKYFKEPLATRLEIKRDEARKKHRITYDCFNAIVGGGQVKCIYGHFSHFIALLTALRGRSSAMCVKCVDYDNGGEACG